MSTKNFREASDYLNILKNKIKYNQRKKAIETCVMSLQLTDRYNFFFRAIEGN